MRPIVLGVLSALFFAFTFILNHSMELSGGSWLFSASLRYFFMIPFLVLIVAYRKGLVPLLIVMKERPRDWFVYSFIGFGLFYAPLCFAASYSPGWLIAGTWQVTIISGSLLAPFFFISVAGKKVRGKIPLKGLLMSLIILLGIALLYLEQADDLTSNLLLFGVLPILIASFAYPLGNRKMMEVTGGRLDAYQRVLGMTLASLPLWLILAAIGLAQYGLPSTEQTVQSFLVALSSGVVATVLFFSATDLVRGNMAKLAAVEATQSMEVLFAVIGEILLLGTVMPSPLAWVGMGVIMLGMILHSYISHRPETAKRKTKSA
ncbi:DMT family transporter [Exiguobacterium flavidum]|uniref:DMT family transporter n=1 Tax=Exiguobacterium flavidum TaxID=2184695 RepID=UPI000DF86509|nr:multidrug resistance efflux transporter family protein [Exiguobacterium flavidum]